MSITPVAWLLPPGAHCEVRVSLAAAARQASCRPLFWVWTWVWTLVGPVPLPPPPTVLGERRLRRRVQTGHTAGSASVCVVVTGRCAETLFHRVAVSLGL